MDAMKSVIAFCLLAGILILCVFLIVNTVLRWLKPEKKEDRAGRLNILAAIAAFILIALFVVSNYQRISVLFGYTSGVMPLTAFLMDSSKFFVKVLIFGTITISVVLLICAALMIAYLILDAFKQSPQKGGLKDVLIKKSDSLKEVMKTPIVMLVITGGVLAVFLILPLLMGNSASGHLSETWQDGVQKIVTFIGSTEAADTAQTSESSESPDGEEPSGEPEAPDGTEPSGEPETSDEERPPEEDESKPDNSSANAETQTATPFYKALLKYILIYIIVIGVGFAALKILYSIIENTFAKTDTNGFLGEYSSSIGVLAVGISLLLSIQKIEIDVFQNDPVKMIGTFLSSFAIVIFIIALAVLTLEIIRLLVDMRETLIRRESRYLFISLIGQVSMLLLEAVSSLYQAVSSVIGSQTNDGIKDMQEELKEKIAMAARKEMTGKKDYKSVFSGFDKKVTKK